MTNINTATRSELEIIIIQNNLEYMFGTLNEIIREKITDWIIEGDEYETH